MGDRWREQRVGGGRCFFFQAEDGIRDLVRSRGLGDVYKRQAPKSTRSIVSMKNASLARLTRRRRHKAGKTDMNLSLIHI